MTQRDLGACEAPLCYFVWEHLPAALQPVSKACADLANAMTDVIPQGPELNAGLRKLLEAKDCFVRAALAQRFIEQGTRKITPQSLGFCERCHHALHLHNPDGSCGCGMLCRQAE